LPAAPIVVCLWLTWLAARALRASTLKVYLFGLVSAHTDSGLRSPTDDSTIIERVMRGIKRYQRSGPASKPRLPVTTAILNSIEPFFDFNCPDHRLVYAAMRVCTAGLFRIGELAVDPRTASDSDRLCRLQQLSFSADGRHATILLRASKSDVFRQTVSVVVSEPRAMRALRQYLSARPYPLLPASPLFADQYGKPLSRRALLRATAAAVRASGISTVGYEGFSFRRGGATSLAIAGVQDSTIRVLGRWRSWAYQQYIECPIAQLVAAGFRM
jgi:hypothetical protein